MFNARLILGSVGATLMNDQSSRSHAIFTVTIESSERGLDKVQHVHAGKLHLVDLAVSRYNKSNISFRLCMRL